MNVSQVMSAPISKVQQVMGVANPIKQQKTLNLQGPDKDVFEKSTKKEFSNDDAMKLMREELKDAMSEKELDNYMEFLAKSCEQLEIEPKNLPINEEHPGNLTEDQRKQLFFLMKYDSMEGLSQSK